MLFIQKGQCPEIVKQAFNAIQEDESWKAIPQSAEGLNDEERHRRVTLLRAVFDDLRVKSEIKDALLQEQHNLCAYCMSRISNEYNCMSIEHWSPLSNQKGNVLSFENYLGVCTGGKNLDIPKGEHRIICCDASKGENEITIDPRNQEMMDLIYYDNEGILLIKESQEFDRAELQKDIDQTLKLNGILREDHTLKADTATAIVKARKDAYNAAEAYCKMLLDQRKLTKATLQAKIKSILDEPNQVVMPGVCIFVIQFYSSLL